MVGDTIDADIDGALAIGMRAVLVDRLDQHPGAERITDLYALPEVLGVTRL